VTKQAYVIVVIDDAVDRMTADLFALEQAHRDELVQGRAELPVATSDHLPHSVVAGTATLSLALGEAHAIVRRYACQDAHLKP
jgi:hypothetical protein